MRKKSTAEDIAAVIMAASKMKMDPFFERKVKGPVFKVNEEMQYEGLRLATFKNWPNWGAVWPTILAKAGFFYTGSMDQVACFCCSGRLKTWEGGDSPMTEHKRFFPQCRFITGRDSANVPLGETAAVLPSGRDCHNLTESHCRLAMGTLAGHGQTSGQLLMNHLTPAINRQRQSSKPGQYNSLQYSAVKCVPSVNSQSGLNTATRGATGTLPLTVEQLQEMKLESKRLESFSNWPASAFVRPEHLATAGVYYLGVADRVKCAFCNGIMRNWQPADDPMDVHQKLFPKCAFVKDARTAGNMSIDEEKANARQASQNAVANTSPSLGVVTPESMSLDYVSEKSRRLSFRRWPRSAKQTADDLAQAGFYYVGNGDTVKCFSCDGVLGNWKNEDNVWTKHARTFPHCTYVRTTKGDAFIRSAQPTHSGQTNSTRTVNSTADVTQSGTTGERKYPVDPRMVRARMDTTRVRSILDMGFTRDLLSKVIEHHLATTGDDFPNVQTLMEAVFAAELALSDSSSPQASVPSSEPAAAAAAAVVDETVAGKNKKRRKKNKSGIMKTDDTKTSVSASEPSLSLEKKPEVKEATGEDQRLQCKICMDDEASILFLPCGHLCCCPVCAPALHKCAICRAVIRGTVRVYLS